jgi:hypothetical protein
MRARGRRFDGGQGTSDGRPLTVTTRRISASSGQQHSAFAQ